MKKMISLLILFTLLLTSCSNDDDRPDPFIGTWYLYKVFVNDTETILSDCKKLTNILVNANGLVTSTSYDDSSGTCHLGLENGIWENQENSNYVITFNEGSTIINITFEGSNTFYYSSDVNGTNTYKKM